MSLNNEPVKHAGYIEIKWGEVPMELRSVGIMRLRVYSDQGRIGTFGMFNCQQSYRNLREAEFVFRPFYAEVNGKLLVSTLIPMMVVSENKFTGVKAVLEAGDIIMVAEKAAIIY